MKKVANKKIANSAIILSMVIFAATVIFATLLIKNLVNESSIVASASTDERVKAAADRVKAQEEEIKRLQAAKEAAERDKANLEHHRGELNVMLANFDANMAEIVTKIAELEYEIELKILDIEQAELDLAEAIQIKEKQYSDMKKRVKYTYERQEFTMLETLLSASNLSDFLNYADYFEQLAGYEQMKLDQFFETERIISAYKDFLEEEKEKLDFFLAEVEVEQTSF
ncbi:MAG: hypothetical protein FWE14_10955 [Lachnospiraceae bacterium]|nr:hypothetical protein [Lachnospiraceae bacterium]